MELEAGDMVAADGRILHNYSLQVNESSLTGESTNVDKQEMALEGEVRWQTAPTWFIRKPGSIRKSYCPGHSYRYEYRDR